MKKFTKLFLSCALVSVVAMATAAMASAEAIDLKPAKTNGLEGSYDAGVLTVTLPEDIDTAKEATLLVVEGTEYTTDTAVVGIDQATGGVFDKTGLKGAPTDETAAADGYTVMLGYYPENDGAFTILKATLFGSVTDTITVKLGDADLDGNVKQADAIYTLKKANGLDARGVDVKFADKQVTPDSGTAVYLCDVDGDGNVKQADAIYVLKKANGLDARGVDVKNAGQEVDVDVEDWMPATAE